MKAVLTSDDDYPFLAERAKGAMTEWRSDLGLLLRRKGDALQFDGTTVSWWTVFQRVARIVRRRYADVTHPHNCTRSSSCPKFDRRWTSMLFMLWNVQVADT
jgi:hypothetical protein